MRCDLNNNNVIFSCNAEKRKKKRRGKIVYFFLVHMLFYTTIRIHSLWMNVLFMSVYFMYHYFLALAINIFMWILKYLKLVFPVFCVKNLLNRLVYAVMSFMTKDFDTLIIIQMGISYSVNPTARCNFDTLTMINFSQTEWKLWIFSNYNQTLGHELLIRIDWN